MKSEVNSKMNSRLNRISGQINGITKMIENKEDCEKISIQFKAVKSAIEKVFHIFLNENIKSCVSKNNNTKLQKMIGLILKQ